MLCVCQCALSATDPTTLAPLSLHQLCPNLLVREMVERWLDCGDALGDAADGSDAGGSAGGAGCAAAVPSTVGPQTLQRQGSDDPLSSFGASSSSSTGGSSGSDMQDLLRLG